MIARRIWTVPLIGFGASAAQAAPPPDAASETIIVTGERVRRPLLATSSSVAVTTAEAIEAQAAPDRIEQLLALVPNVTIGTGGQGPTIRGQDSTGVLQDLPGFLGGARPRMTMQIDGRAVGYNELVFGAAPIWDVEQVEVFRSPQTTTQGRNAIGGAIFIRTRDPAWDWEAGTRLIAGTYETRQASAFVSGPLIAGQLAFRIAADARDSRTASKIADRIRGADPNRDDYSLVRLKFLAEPKALPGVSLETTYVHQESEAPQVEGVRVPFEDREDPLPGYGVFVTNVDSMTAVLDYEPDDSLAWTTTLAAGDSYVRRYALPGLGQTVTRSNDFSAESIIRWKPDAAPLDLLAGASHISARFRQSIDLSAVLGTGDFTDRQRSFGIFGEATTDVVQTLQLTAGLRYQRDNQRRDGFIGTPALGFGTDYDRTFDAWLPKLSVRYEIAEDIAAGILVQRAFNPGGMTINLDTGESDIFGAETLWNYEAFLRAARGDVTLSANLFYNDLSNAQRAQPRAFRVPGGATAFWADIQNVSSAESYGLEAELTWRAGRRLTLRAGLGLLKTRILETDDPADPILGKEFQRSPHVSGSAAIDWRAADSLRLSAQLRHRGGYFSNDANTPALRIGKATVVDARASYSIGGATLFGYVRNAFDDFTLTYLFSPIQGTAGDPREIGFGIEARF